jgi:D-arabinose 1-dehydrogenase-like Zn-dependent alcohol dehydrogenase
MSTDRSGEKRVKAIVFHQFGLPEVLRLEQVPAPAPGPGELLLKVHAVSVNRTLDLAVRAVRTGRSCRMCWALIRAAWWRRSVRR